MKISVQQAEKLFNECIKFDESGIVNEESQIRTIARQTFGPDNHTIVEIVQFSLVAKEVYKVLAQQWVHNWGNH